MDLDAISAFLTRHKVTAFVLGGFVSATFGAVFWLAQGGAVAFLTSVRALSTPEIASTIEEWPEYHETVMGALARLEARSENQGEVLVQMADALETLRMETEAVVEWAPDHSQRLTDAVGGCHAGQTECPVYFRGRRTQAGAACELSAARPRLTLADGREYPIRFSPGFEMLPLGRDYQTLEVLLQIPDFIPPGLAGVVVLTLYADCPFAGEGEIIERETFRLLVEITEAP